jgi:hypothetical protein
MIDDKNSVDMVDQKKAPIHLSTIDGDISLDNLVIEDRERKEKALVRKVDIRMMPLMMLLYVLNYLDRNNIATARLGTLEKDLGLHGKQYNTIISIFFVGKFQSLYDVILN